MNNRPLFWAVLCFALGEVLYIIADKGSEIGTASVVLIFAVLLIKRTKLSWMKMVVYPLIFIAGFARIYMADYTFVSNVLFGKGEYATWVNGYEGYEVLYNQGILENSQGNTDVKHMQRQVEIEGVGIVDNIAPSSKGYNVTIKLVESKMAETVISDEYKIIIYGMERELLIGDKLWMKGNVCDFVPSNNPGEFNRRAYYKARGIVGYCFGKDVIIQEMEDIYVNETEAMWYVLKDRLYHIKTVFGESLYRICDGESSGLFSGILLGEKGNIPEEDMLLYRLSGIAHIFAISGLHIGIVGGLLYKLLRKLGLIFLPATVIAVFVTLMYGVMTGFSFSTIRAIVMLAISLGGEVLGRRYDMLTGMGIALFVLLIVEPFRIMDGGLILSFGAVAGVAVSKYIVKLMEKNKWFRELQRKKYRRVYGIIASLIFSSGITLVTAPLVAYMYFQIPLYSVLINMLVVPLMTITVFCGFFGVLFGLISSFLGKVIIFPGVLSLKLYKCVCTIFQYLPMDVIDTGKPQILELVIYYVVLAVVLIGINSDVVSWIRRKAHDITRKWISYVNIKRACSLVMVVIVLLGVLGISLIRISGNGEKVTFLDVGQGDGVLIRTEGGCHIAIDIGSASNDSLGEYVACPALLTEFNGRVDYWFISHFDKDHTSGLEYILASELDMGITIENLVVSEACLNLETVPLVEIAKEKGINVISMNQGDCIVGEDFRIKCIHPDISFDSDDRNEQSLVISYESDTMKLLLTGDVGEEAIMHMLRGGTLDKDYDILKVPHHGSKYSYSMKFLEQINGEVAVISCGAQNSYGHPHREMLEGLDAVGCDIYMTLEGGAIVIEKRDE